jgi:hypothetical protein
MLSIMFKCSNTVQMVGKYFEANIVILKTLSRVFSEKCKFLTASCKENASISLSFQGILSSEYLQPVPPAKGLSHKKIPIIFFLYLTLFYLYFAVPGLRI